MHTSQQINRSKKWYRATAEQRIIAALMFSLIAGAFVFLWLGAHGKINIDVFISPCGFKQQYGWPCPTCGVTTAALAFMRGNFGEAFYIQPAGGFLCCVLIVVGFLSFPVAVFGVYFRFLDKFFSQVKTRYIILTLVVVILAGWAVTLVRALVEKMQ